MSVSMGKKRNAGVSVVHVVTWYDGDREHFELCKIKKVGLELFETMTKEVQAIAKRELGDHDYPLVQTTPMPDYHFAGVGHYWTTLSIKKILE